MGMDVYGVNPQIKSERPERPETDDYDSDDWSKHWDAMQAWEQENVGAYFRNNVWWWRPLWDYVNAICDDVLTEEDHQSGHHNDGHLIDADKCQLIAERLAHELLNGGVTKFKDERQQHLDKLPNRTCTTCDGTGDRDSKNCHTCDGTGEQEHWDRSYPFEEANVREFLSFIKESGGFEIS